MPLDSYSRAARLAPGLLLLLGPFVLAVGAGLPKWPLAATLTSAGVTMGLSLALAEWVRRRGQRLQIRLWAAWGGNPVAAALREDGLVAQRRRKALAEATKLPVDDPAHPDFGVAIENAVRRLISATRDTSQYPLVFAENKAYGFARTYSPFDLSGFLYPLSLFAQVPDFRLPGFDIAQYRSSELSSARWLP